MKAQQVSQSPTFVRRTSVSRSRWLDLGLLLIATLVTALTGTLILAPAGSRSALHAERVVPGPPRRSEVIALDPAAKSVMQYIQVHETVSPDSGVGAWCERLPSGMRSTALFCRRVVQRYSLLNRYLSGAFKSTGLDPG